MIDYSKMKWQDDDGVIWVVCPMCQALDNGCEYCDSKGKVTIEMIEETWKAFDQGAWD